MAKKKKETVKKGATAKAITAVDETPAFSGETMTAEIPAQDHVPTEKEELPLKDEVLVHTEDLPQVDKVEIGEPTAENVLEAAEIQASQPYVPAEHFDEPASKKQWVADAALLKKVEGYRDTLNGTLYLGILK